MTTDRAAAATLTEAEQRIFEALDDDGWLGEHGEEGTLNADDLSAVARTAALAAQPPQDDQMRESFAYTVDLATGEFGTTPVPPQDDPARESDRDGLREVIVAARDAHDWPTETDDGLVLRCRCGLHPPISTALDETAAGLWLWHHQHVETANAVLVAGFTRHPDTGLRDDQSILDGAKRLRSVMHRTWDDRDKHYLTLCGVRALDVPHTNGDGTPLTCPRCAALAEPTPGAQS